MQPPESIEEAKVWAVVLGGLGSALSLNSIQGLGWGQRVMTVLTGAVMAGVLSQPIVAWVDFPAGFSDAVSFLVGMFGVSIAGSIIKMFKTADLWLLASEVLRSWFKKGGG